MTKAVEATVEATVVVEKEAEGTFPKAKLLIRERGVLKLLPLPLVSPYPHRSALVFALSSAAVILRTRGVDPESVNFHICQDPQEFHDYDFTAPVTPLEHPKTMTTMEFKQRIVQADPTLKDNWRYDGQLIDRVYMRFEGYGRARFKAAVLLSQDRAYSIRSLQFGPRAPEWFHELVVKAFAKSK